MNITEQDKQRFFDKVDKNGPIVPYVGTPCWIWRAGISHNGYGIFWIDGKNISAHKVSWIMFYGEIPDSKWVLHKCDNKTCVNPNHLFLGYSIDNIHDMMKKHRDKYHTNPATHLRGSAHGSSKLTESQVISIRALSNRYSQRQLARMFKVARRSIVLILQRKTWTHV